MTATALDPALSALQAACITVGVDGDGATLMRASENSLYRLRGGIVARVTRPGQQAVAAKEVLVSRWLASIGFPVVQVADGVEQPVSADGRAVTFWQELPSHTAGSPIQVGQILRALHALPLPADLTLPHLNPLVRLAERVEGASQLEGGDREWLAQQVEELSAAWASLPPGRPWCAVHGDAWGGNIVSTTAGVVMLDLERFAYGPPEWDLTAMAVDRESFGAISAADWRAVCDGYGLDVTTWEGYDTLRSIRELRKVTFAWQIADQDPARIDQARYRLACIQGREGPRPWNWVAVVS